MSSPYDLIGATFFIMIGIYKVTNPKGKIYIGQSINIKKRFGSYKRLECKGQTLLYRSLCKYGVDNHKFEILQICERDCLNELEKYYVELFQTFNNKNGLNLKEGGSYNVIYSFETRKKMSELAKLRRHSDETKQKLSIIHKAKSHDALKKMAISRIGIPRTESVILKLKQRTNSAETRQKISNSKRNSPNSKHSEETKQKISLNRSKIILDTQTGVFYFGAKDASPFCKNSKVLSNKLSGNTKNNTNYIYV